MIHKPYNTNISLLFALFEQENKLGLSRNSTVVTMQTPYHDATCGVVLKTKEKYITAGKLISCTDVPRPLSTSE